jgi:hypothetical protein
MYLFLKAYTFCRLGFIEKIMENEGRRKIHSFSSNINESNTYRTYFIFSVEVI